MNPHQALSSGQVFLWYRRNGFWYGVDGSVILRVDDAGNVESSGPDAPPDFFRYTDDLSAITASLSQNDLLRNVIDRYPDMRITRQAFFQCVISFVVSANSNIPRIRQNLQAICDRFGDVAHMDDMAFSTFPGPDILASADIADIASCGTGYRSRYIQQTSVAIRDGFLGVDELRRMPYKEARQSLTMLPGVGNKVADCIMLFSLDFLEAVPMDRWLVRVLHTRYGIGDGSTPGTDRVYDKLHDQAVRLLGPYAGYAQQYLFKMIREDSGKTLKW